MNIVLISKNEWKESINVLWTNEKFDNSKKEFVKMMHL